MTLAEQDPKRSAPLSDPFDELGKRKRPWWILTVAIVIAIAASAVVYARKHRAPPPPRFLFGHVTQGDLVESIEATGTVQPVVQVQVGAQVSGRILHLHADYNTRVHAGQLIAEIDPLPFQTVVSQARAALLSAQASLARARADLALADRNLTRAQDLRTRGLNAPADLDAAVGTRDSARAQVQVAVAEVARSQAALDTARTNLDYCRIVAPIDGVVITRSIDEGQTVAASFQAPVLFVIANDLTRMRVMADVDEADIGKLREGMQAEARVDAFPGESFRGVVHELRFGPTTTQGVVTYPAVIDVSNPDLKLRPGMTANITVVTAERHGSLRVPNAALRFHPSPAQGTSPASAHDTPGSGGAHGPHGDVQAGPHAGRVYVEQHGQAVAVDVVTGISDGVMTEVQSPTLHAGENVITDETDEAARGANAQGGGRRRMF